MVWSRERKWSHLGVTLKRCLPAAMKWTDLHQPWLHTHSNRAEQAWPKTSETMSWNKHFLLISCLVQAFCHNNRKLTNTSGNQVPHFRSKRNPKEKETGAAWLYSTHIPPPPFYLFGSGEVKSARSASSDHPAVREPGLEVCDEVLCWYQVIRRKQIHAQDTLPVKAHVTTDTNCTCPEECAIFNRILLNLHTYSAGFGVEDHVSLFCPPQDQREISVPQNSSETSVDMFWEQSLKWLILLVFSNPFQLLGKRLHSYTLHIRQFQTSWNSSWVDGSKQHFLPK